MQTTYPEGWLRLTQNDKQQHFFRDGMSICGVFVTPTTKFPEDDGPDGGECPGCRSIFDNERGTARY